MACTLSKNGFVLLLSFVLVPAASAQGGGFFLSRKTGDSAVTVANKEYQPHSFLRRLFMGSNYRSVWEQEVRVPVFHLSDAGFRIKDLGGGMQTKSLHLVDAGGKQWALRTVNKEVTDAALTPVMRNRLGRGLSQDLISAAFPYAAPLAGELASAAGIRAARPAVFYVGDDLALGRYRELFAGTLCTLEERDPGFDSTESSETALKRIRSDGRYQIQQEVYLQARLLDMLIADWDRHADNWRWGLQDSAGGHFYYAVPRDRDWAFYHGQGLVPWLTQKAGSVPCLVPFTKNLKKVKAQSWKSWEMDREFTNGLDAAAWTRILALFCASLTDEAIDRAVKILPASVYRTGGKGFAEKLKSRRDGMGKEVMQYYRFLAGNVVINGSDDDETFTVSAAGDRVSVTICQSATQRLLYRRTFLPSETYGITLNGLGGNDLFRVTGDVSSPIRFVLAGGAGRDAYDIRGAVRSRINDSAADADEMIYRGKAKLHIE